MWVFPRGKIILGVLEMPGTPQKPKWAAATITKLAQKLEKMSKINENQTFALSQPFALGPLRFFGRK